MAARATEKGLTWELNTGHVKPVSHYAVLRCVQDWFSLQSLWLVRDYREEAGADALREREGLGDPALVFDSVWSYVLANTIAEGHGGAFAVLPDDAETCLDVKYRASGIDLYDRSRLAEEGINNVEALAHYDIVRLLLRTRRRCGAGNQG